MKLKIVKKAYQCWELGHGYKAYSMIIHAKSPGEAKGEYKKDAYVPFLDIGCVRDYDSDIVEYEGEQNTYSIHKERINRRLWLSSLKEMISKNPLGKVLIYSGQWQMYWREDSKGYSRYMTDAGIYDIQDAYTRVSHCDTEKQIQFILLSEYTGIAWKNHIASDFEEGLSPAHPNGAGKGGTIFFDYEFMVSYLKKNGKE